jgi:hypothetical protein
MSKSPASTQRSRFHPALLLLLASGVIGVSAWSAMSSPAMASILSISYTATPTHFQPYAFAEIAKPTYTAIPAQLQLPTSVPTEVIQTDPSPTPSIIDAVIVPDTPTPEYTVLAPPDAPSYAGNKYILVDISDQYMYVYEGETLLYNFIASTGMRNSTRVGTFSVLDKIPNAYGATWNIWMPNWLGIYYSGGLENGIHSLPILPNGAQLWEGYLGTPISYGCVVLGAYESTLLYNWAEIGTPVEIRW